MYAFPAVMCTQIPVINIPTPIKLKMLLIINLIKNLPSLNFLLSSSYKNIPYISPIIAWLNVYPGKYAPNGNNNAPIKSPSNAIIALYFGPKKHSC